MKKNINCPKCYQPMVQVGSLWFCQTHGNAHKISQQFAAKSYHLQELFSQRRYSKILSICDKLIKEDPDCAEAYAFRGLALEEMGWAHEALVNYNQAIELDPNYSVPIRDRGLLYLRMGEAASAQEDFESYKSMSYENDNSLQKLIDDAKMRPIVKTTLNTVTARIFKQADGMVKIYLLSLVVIIGLLLWNRNTFQQSPWGFKAFFIFTLLFLIGSIWRWLQFTRVGDKTFWNLVKPMIRFCFVSRQRKLLNSASRVNLIFAIVLVLGLYPLPIIFYCSILTLGLGVVLTQSLPPTILFLASSNASSAKNWDQINKVTYPYRSIALLSINELIIHWPIKANLKDDNFRTEDRCMWRLVVHPLMEIAPIIVVDENCDTPFVLEEVERLIQIGAIEKTFFISEYKSFPVLNKMKDKLGDKFIRTIDSNNAPMELRLIISKIKTINKKFRKTG